MSMKTNRRAVWITASALALVAAGAFIWSELNEIRQAPEKTADAVPDMSRQSTIALPFEVSLDTLQQIANREAPRTLFTMDEGRNACVPAKWVDECIVRRPFSSKCLIPVKTKITPEIDCHLRGSVNRGDIVMGGQGSTITATVPIAASVQATGRGAIGHHISITANGAITATAAVAARIDENWNPQADIAVDYNWSQRLGVDVLGQRITFASRVDPKLREGIEQARTKLPELLNGLRLRAQVEAIWPKAFTTTRIADTPEAWVRFIPTAVGFGGYTVEERMVRGTVVAAGMAETILGSEPQQPTPTPLPKLQANVPVGGFSFVLPIRLPYRELAVEMKKLLTVGEPRRVTVERVGEVAFKFTNVDIYQTTERRLAIGVTLEADTQQSFFDTKGTVWFIASLVADNDRKVLRVENLEIHSKTDNVPVDLLISLVRNDTINASIRKSLEHDFMEDYGRLKAQAQQLLNRRITDDVAIEGTLREVRVDGIINGPDALVIALSATGDAKLRLVPK